MDNYSAEFFVWNGVKEEYFAKVLAAKSSKLLQLGFGIIIEHPGGGSKHRTAVG